MATLFGLPLVLLLVLPMITVLPGAWLAFGLPLRRFSTPTRLALAVTLTPAVLGAEYIVLTLLHVPFPAAAWVMLLINVPSLLLILRGHWHPNWQAPALRGRGYAWLGLALLGVLALVLIVPWLLIPYYRMYSWHALMHSNIIYRLTAFNSFPEEPELAGLDLSYPWLGHVYWATLGTVADTPPTLLYPLSNLIWLAAGFTLAYAVMREGFRLRPASAVFGAAFTFLATQSVAFAARIATWNIDLGGEYFGWRLSPVLEKYRGFEVMPFAFALLLALLLAVVVSLRRDVNLAVFGVLEAALLIATGMVYTVLISIGFVLVGCQVLLLMTRWGEGVPHHRWRDIGLLVGALGVAFIACLVLYVFYFHSTHGPLPLAWAGVKTRLYQTITALLPFWLLALPALWVAWRQRDGLVLTLGIATLVACVLHLFMRLGTNEYKFVLFASLTLGPLCALTVDRWFDRAPSWQWPVAVGIPLALVALDLVGVLGLGMFMDPPLQFATPLDERHYQVALDPRQSDAAWVQAVRERTPADTMVVAENLGFYLGPFVQRVLYVPSDSNGQDSPGYSMNNRFHLVDQRRYAGADYDARAAERQVLFQSCDAAALNGVLANLRQYRRPLAIVFDNPKACALDYLRRKGPGTQFFADGQHTVWLIDNQQLARAN